MLLHQGGVAPGGAIIWGIADLIAQFFNLVEPTRHWPAAPKGADVILLPKGGTPDTFDRRPITFPSLLYRVRGAIGGRDLRQWMQ